MGTRPFCICFYCICRHCIHVMPGLRRRGGNGERRRGAHGVARSHWRVLYHIRRDEITVRTKSNCRANRRGAPAMLTHAQREAHSRAIACRPHSSSLRLVFSATARFTASSFVKFPIMTASPVLISACMMGAATSSPFTTIARARPRSELFFAPCGW